MICELATRVITRRGSDSNHNNCVTNLFVCCFPPCTARCAGPGLKNSWSPCCRMKCRFSALTPPLRTGCAFLPLERPSSFSGRIPRQQCGGKGRARPAEHFIPLFVLLHRLSFVIIIIKSLFLYTSRVSKLCQRIVAFCVRKRERVRSGGKNCSQTVSCFFFSSSSFFFFSLSLSLWLQPLFFFFFLTHGLLGDEIGRVRLLGLVVYVVPGLCRRRRDGPIPQQHNKETRTGATSCPQAAKEAKLCQVAAHPAADAKHPPPISAVTVSRNKQTVDYLFFFILIFF